MEPFRDSGGGSPTLAALAAAAGAGVPRQSTLLTAEQIRERLELAADVRADTGSAGLAVGLVMSALFGLFGVIIAAAPGGGPFETGAAWVAVVAIGLTIGLGAAVARSAARAKARRDAVVAAMVSWPTRLPFPTDGFTDHLVSDRPLVDVVVAAPIERRLFADAAKAIDAAIEVEPVGDRTFRLVMPARSHIAATKTASRSIRFADRRLIAAVFDRMIVPLHAESGVEAVHFGGTIAERN